VADGKYTYGDLIHIAKHIAGSNRPFMVEGTMNLSELTKEGGNGKERRTNYIDSSIWLRYVNTSEERGENGKTLSERHVEKEFKTYYKLGLYKTSRAKENREFTSRLLRNSYLNNVDDKGHGNDVVPFIFHSETVMKKKYEEVRDKLNKYNKRNNIEWRILILDDHATEKKAKDVCKEGKEVVSKCKILQEWFVDLGFNVSCNGCISNDTKQEEYKTILCPKLSKGRRFIGRKFNVFLECAETIDEAKKALQYKKYDLILLDYLIKEKNETRYAYQLLSEIKAVFDENTKQEEKQEELQAIKDIEERYNNETYKIKYEKIRNLTDLRKNWFRDKEDDGLIKQRKGSGGRFKFLFMSAFVNAVQNRMLQLGLLPHTPYWDLSHGACPTTTPNLFKYYLLQTMYDQLHEMSFLQENLDNEKIISLLDLLFAIYKSNGEQARQNAITYFNALLKIRLKYDILKFDVSIDNCEENQEMKEENKSLLVKSLFPDVGFFDNAFWEHIMHLVYLTAYGTIRQWPDMWEEYRFIKSNLENAEKKIFVKPTVSNHIESYIINLKNKS